jgi:UDP-N-acetylmuramate--alanine ligase
MKGRHLHFMGIGGVGMCGLAEVLIHQGVTVSGCDIADSERTRRLADLGVVVHHGHDPSHVNGVDGLVVTAAVDPQAPELAAARADGVTVVRRAELLAELMRGRSGIAVAGTHGKTTTTAMIGHMLTAAGEDPTVIVGGRAAFMDSHARVGSGPWFVCEADEYDRAFLELAPSITVITNLEPEHLDCYDDLDDLEQAFVAFANRASVFGTVVLCADDPGSRRLRPRLRRRVISYGTATDAELKMKINHADPGGTRFQVFERERGIGEIHLPVPGAFNARNAMAAIAVGLEIGLDFEEIAAACAAFRGVARRFDLRGERQGVAVVDDYAHHPTEIAAVLEATRQALPGRRIVAVFQPHLYSRTQRFAKDFASVLLGADVAVVLPVYAARERPVNGVTSALVVEEAARLGHPAVMEGAAVDRAVEQLRELIRPGDVLLTIGAGDVDRVATAWLKEA